MWNLDKTIPPVVFDQAALNPPPGKKYRIGVFRNDHFSEPAACCLRAVNEAAEALRAAGHDVVEFAPRVSTRAAALMYYALMGADGKLRSFRSGLEGEALHPIYRTLSILAGMPDFLIRGLIALILGLLGMHRAADLLRVAKSKSAYETWGWQQKRAVFRNKFFQEWEDNKLDLLICPVIGLPAIPHGESSNLTVACSYTFLFNTLHMPAGSVPVTHVQKDEAHYTCPTHQMDKFAKASIKAMTAPDVVGLPVGVQVVGMPYRDEMVLAGMRELSLALGQKRTSCPEATIQATIADIKNIKA